MDAAGHTLDATVYPETDAMGEHEVQRYISELLRSLVIEWLFQRQRVGHVGANQFFYWVLGDPTRTRAPDVYVIEGLPQDHPDQAEWKTWEGHAPVFAVEVVSGNWRKDYDDAPRDYDAMGTQELVLFDPAATLRSRKRVRWQLFRRVRGRLKRVATSKGDRVESRYLGCFMRAVIDRSNTRLRLATGHKGDVLVPTDGERLAEERKRAEAEAERAEAEAERAEAEAERAEAEAERAETAERQALTERIARETLAVQLQTERDARAEAEAALARALDELARLRRGRREP